MKGKKLMATNKLPVYFAYIFMLENLSHFKSTLKIESVILKYIEKFYNCAMKTNMFLYTLIYPDGLMSLVMCC